MATCTTRLASKSAPQIGKLGFTLTSFGSSQAQRHPLRTAATFESTSVRQKSSSISSFPDRLSPAHLAPLAQENSRGGINRISFPLYLPSASILALIAGFVAVRENSSIESKCEFATEDRDEIQRQPGLPDKNLLRSAEEDIRRLELDSARYPQQVSGLQISTQASLWYSEANPKWCSGFRWSFTGGALDNGGCLYCGKWREIRRCV